MGNHMHCGPVNQKPANTGTYETVVDTGASGVLKGVGVVSVEGTDSCIKVELDGQPIGSGKICAGMKEYGNDGLPFDHSFDDRLVVKGKNNSNQVKPRIRFWVTWITDNSPMIDREEFNKNGMVYERKIYETDEEEEYSVESVLGLEHLSKIEISDDIVFEDDSIEGKIYLRKRTKESDQGVDDVSQWILDKRGDLWTWVEAEADDVELDAQVPGSERSMLHEPVNIGKVQGEETFNLDRSMLRDPDYSGDLQIRAIIEGWENYPDNVKIM